VGSWEKNRRFVSHAYKNKDRPLKAASKWWKERIARNEFQSRIVVMDATKECKYFLKKTAKSERIVPL